MHENELKRDQRVKYNEIKPKKSWESIDLKKSSQKAHTGLQQVNWQRLSKRELTVEGL